MIDLEQAKEDVERLGELRMNNGGDEYHDDDLAFIERAYSSFFHLIEAYQDRGQALALATEQRDETVRLAGSLKQRADTAEQRYEGTKILLAETEERLEAMTVRADTAESKWAVAQAEIVKILNDRDLVYALDDVDLDGLRKVVE